MPTTTRDKSGFTLASHQSQALCLGTLGLSGLLWPIAVWGFSSPLRFLAGWAAAGSGVWLLMKARERWRLHQLEEGLLVDNFSAVPMPAEVVSGGNLHPDVRRLLEFSNTKFPEKLTLDPSSLELEEDTNGKSKLVSWGFKCETGYLAETTVQAKLQNAFQSSLGGNWSFKFDTIEDTFKATQKSSIPKLAFPRMWRVVGSADEAKRLYPGWKFVLGVTTGGRELGFSPIKWPHVRVIGETGSGKSVAVLSWLEQFRAAGWMIILADGKGQDYVGYSAPDKRDHNLPVPGTVAVGVGATPRGMSYVGAITMAYKIMEERQSTSMQDKVADPTGWDSYPPVLLVMDEIKAMREKWSASLSKYEMNAVTAMISQITALGRALRVHVVLISQDAYIDSMPSGWTSNVPLSVCLGRPKDNTVQRAFEKSSIPLVKQIRGSMDPETKGRGIITARDDDTGAYEVMEYQGYFSYAPGESWEKDDIPAGTSVEWPKFKTEVSDRVPRLWSRMWFRIEHKSEAQTETETEGNIDLGFIDFDQFTPAEIMHMDRVLLDVRNSDGVIAPNPDMAKYDPSSTQYVCRPPAGSVQVLNPEL